MAKRKKKNEFWVVQYEILEYDEEIVIAATKEEALKEFYKCGHIPPDVDVCRIFKYRR